MNKKVTIYRICSVQLPKLWINSLGEVETTAHRFIGKYLSSTLGLTACSIYHLTNHCFGNGQLLRSSMGPVHEDEIHITIPDNIFIRYRYYVSENFMYISAFFPTKSRTRRFFAADNMLYETSPWADRYTTETISRLMTIAKQLRGKK